jgi:hypothetical protein
MAPPEGIRAIGFPHAKAAPRCAGESKGPVTGEDLNRTDDPCHRAFARLALPPVAQGIRHRGPSAENSRFESERGHWGTSTLPPSSSSEGRS